MKTLESISKDLETNYHDSIMYILNDDEYLVTSELLKCDYGFFDIVIDVQQISEQLKATANKKEVLFNYILYYILNYMGIKISLDKPLYDWIMENHILFEEVLSRRTEDYLDNKIRIHLLLDGVDEDFKYEIIKMMTSKDTKEKYDTIGVVPRVYKKIKKEERL